MSVANRYRARNVLNRAIAELLQGVPDEQLSTALTDIAWALDGRAAACRQRSGRMTFVAELRAEDASDPRRWHTADAFKQQLRIRERELAEALDMAEQLDGHHEAHYAAWHDCMDEVRRLVKTKSTPITGSPDMVVPKIA